MEFRRAGPQDAAAVRDLTRKAYAKWCAVIGREPLPMTADYGHAVRHHMIDLAFIDGRLVGLVEMIPRVDDLLIENVAVDPDEQGVGFGRKLVAHAEEEARMRGYPAIRLYTNKLFAANLRFYTGLGYEIEREEPFKGGTVVHFRKDLAMSADETFMTLAARLGHRALGTTADNPPVGCVIVKDSAMVGLGWTRAGGRPHAETEALKMAGDKARGSTAYVTLEPCAHHGRTPPCAEALVQAGVARVVTAFEDEDPRVSGGGFAILRRAGIVVETGIGVAEAYPALAGFLTRIAKKRPYVILKLALSADSKIAEAPGRRTAITGPEVKARTHLMRAQADAILVGLGTVLADDPDLTCRLPGLEARSPIRVVVDSKLAIPRASQLVRTVSQVPVWLLSLESGAVAPGVEVLTCRPDPQGRVDLTDALAKLAEHGVNRVLAEGGARLARGLVEKGLMDELLLFRSRKVLGPQGVDSFAGLPLDQVMADFRLEGEERLGDDVLSVYVRA
jgi:diaminohydroxyphosphoribosylaminopyrimidine deaminase/5-amino-6-(5-phosphoribosylamino)uracil reductase